MKQFYDSIVKRLIIIIVSLLLFACSKITQENFDKIQTGMSMQQVIAVLGDPTAAQSINFAGVSGTSATWKDNNAEIDIQFLNDKVEIKSFSKALKNNNTFGPDSNLNQNSSGT